MKGQVFFNYYEETLLPDDGAIPAEPYITRDVTLTGSYGNLGDWPHWCLGNLALCQNGVSLDILIKFTDVDETASDLIVFSNGGHSLYSNGVYLLQRYGDEYELGVTLGPHVWNVVFRLKPDIWVNINAVWSEDSGLFVLVDGVAFGDSAPHERDFEAWMFNTFMDVVIGVDTDGTPHTHETRFEIDEISMFNWKAAVVPPSNGKYGTGFRAGHMLRVRNRKIDFEFLDQNICCGYSKEPTQ